MIEKPYMWLINKWCSIKSKFSELLLNVANLYLQSLKELWHLTNIEHVDKNIVHFGMF